MIDKINKSREEQDKEFRENVAPYADPNCKYCYGTGKEHWIVFLEQYKPCECVFENIRILRERGVN